MKSFYLRSKRRKKLKPPMPPRRVKEKVEKPEYKFGPLLSKHTLDQVHAWMWMLVGREEWGNGGKWKEVVVNGWFWRRILDKSKIKYFNRPEGKR